MSAHVRRLQNVLEARCDCSVIYQLFQQEDSSPNSCFGMPVIDLQHSGECRLGDLANRHIILPLDKCLL